MTGFLCITLISPTACLDDNRDSTVCYFTQSVIGGVKTFSFVEDATYCSLELIPLLLSLILPVVLSPYDWGSLSWFLSHLWLLVRKKPTFSSDRSLSTGDEPPREEEDTSM